MVAGRRGWFLVGVILLANCSSRPATEFVHVKVTSGHELAAAVLGGVALFVRDAEPKLRAWRRIETTSALAPALAGHLRGQTWVQTAFVAPEVTPASARVTALPFEKSCPIETPSYEPYQGYLAEAPGGVNAPVAWARAGGRGEGVYFADVEGWWNAKHEDLPGDRMVHAGGQPIPDRNWQAHGTAVVGVVAARDNGIGMVGITPNVDRVVTASIGRVGAAAAIDLAQAALRPGDVLLIELHAIGPRNRFLPVEFWDDVYDAVTVATGRGVIVVAAAGNGGENLDHPGYDGKLDRDVRDSGAILVGAGAPNKAGFTDRSRLSFSNYGSRVDVQGWGRMVATLDYGDLQDCNAANRKYTNLFGGTSSASPVVTGAAIAVQGIVRASGRQALQPRQMRALLAETGSPQVDGPDGPKSQRIGPRPDLARAIERLEAGAIGATSR